MNQENNLENFAENENAVDQENNTTDSSAGINPEVIDNLPIESIGSYARLEDSVNEDEAENTSNPTSQS